MNLDTDNLQYLLNHPLPYGLEQEFYNEFVDYVKHVWPTTLMLWFDFRIPDEGRYVHHLYCVLTSVRTYFYRETIEFKLSDSTKVRAALAFGETKKFDNFIQVVFDMRMRYFKRMSKLELAMLGEIK